MKQLIAICLCLVCLASSADILRETLLDGQVVYFSSDSPETLLASISVSNLFWSGSSEYNGSAYRIDWQHNNLLAGTNIVGPLGYDLSSHFGFAISPSGNAWLVATLADTLDSNLYSVNLNTGAASLYGIVGDGGFYVSSLAIQITPEPSVSALMLIGILIISAACRGR